VSADVSHPREVSTAK